jgi:hypothetical protein
MTALKRILPTLALVTVITVQGAQTPNPSQAQVYSGGDNSIDRIKGHVERITEAVNYAKRSGVTSVDFRGTALLPTAHGEARVQNKQGRVEIAAEFDGLVGAMRFGPEYLTYVMWAITPEGRATNLGEFALKDAKGKLSVSTKLKTFGLIVTAEPYFAVSQPSDAVVMENLFRKGSVGQIQEVEAKYELLPRGSYTATVLPSSVKPIALEPSTPLDLYEARNAVWIALWVGAEENAAELFAAAERLLQKAEAFQASKAGEAPVSRAAREAVQIAENARLLALKQQSENRID